MSIRSVVTIVAGLIVASGVAAALCSMLLGDIRFFTGAFAIISIVALCFGLPIFLAARAARKDTALIAALAGFVLGAAIPAFLVLTGPAADQASVGGTATVIDGRYTFAGWLQNLALIGAFGLLGVGGALVFWIIVRRRGERAEQDEAPLPQRPAAPTAALCVGAAAVVAAAFLIPYATVDRSCHNPLRDGRTSIPPVASFDLQVGVDQWRNIEQEVEQFGRPGAWQKRSDVRTDADFPWFQISLCKEAGTNVFVHGIADLNVVSFGVYQPQGGTSWRVDFRRLYERVDVRWPAKVTFKDGHGDEIGKPEWATSADTRQAR